MGSLIVSENSIKKSRAIDLLKNENYNNKNFMSKVSVKQIREYGKSTR